MSRIRSPRWRLFVIFLSWLIPAGGFITAGGLILSPLFAERLSLLVDQPVRVEARIIACRPHRDGINHRSTIECRFRYRYGGAAYVAQSAAWDSDSPFLTSSDLKHALAKQSSRRTRVADVSRFDPHEARLVDDRLLVMPPLWLWLLGIFIALGVAAVRLDPSGMPYRRAELRPDPETGYLEPFDNKRRNRLRRRIALQILAGSMALVICLFGLSNQPHNIVAKFGMTTLRPTPAYLTGCAYRRNGSPKGPDQIDCRFAYQAGGHLRTGQAESLRFGLFPTKARMRAEVASLPDGTAVTAYVDAQYPDYAWAFIREDMFVPFSWGIFELELWLISLVISVGLVASLFRWGRPDGRDVAPGSMAGRRV